MYLGRFLCFYLQNDATRMVILYQGHLKIYWLPEDFLEEKKLRGEEFIFEKKRGRNPLFEKNEGVKTFF